jgi:NADH-quinone oxidoreductase subunit C
MTDEQNPPESQTPADKEAERAAKIAAAKARAEAAKAAQPVAPPTDAADSEPLDPEKEAKIAAAKAKAAAAKAAREAVGDAPKAAGEGGDPPKAPVKAPAKAAAKKEPAAPAYAEIVGDPFIQELKDSFQGDIKEAVQCNGQQIVRVAPERARDLLWHLRYNASITFNFLTDVTAAHYPDRKCFEVVYQLYAIEENRRLRVKADLPDGDVLWTVTDIWSTANWLEREVYDMFGIRFDGHPDLRRILLPDGWVGFPLRKEYPVEYRPNEWVAQNLKILDLPEGADLTGKFE